MKKFINKNIFLTFLKIGLGLGLLFWLYFSAKIDLSPLLYLIKNPLLILSAMTLFILQIFLGSLRWRLLLTLQSHKNLTRLNIFNIQWIGSFFSTALSGVVTGDLIKLSFIKKRDPELKNSFLLFSIILDRFFGLIGLILLSTLPSFIFYSDILNLNEGFKNILLINFFLFAGVLFFLSIFFVEEKIILKILSLLKMNPENLIIECLFKLRNNKKILFYILLISLLSHFVSTISFHLINFSFYETPLTLKDLLCVLPIGQIAVALPISPAGLGVGHLAYEKLFTFFHQTNGATLFNNYWILLMITNLLGFIPFLYNSLKSSEK